jgi:hypothetical protein
MIQSLVSRGKETRAWPFWHRKASSSAIARQMKRPCSGTPVSIGVRRDKSLAGIWFQLGPRRINHSRRFLVDRRLARLPRAMLHRDPGTQSAQSLQGPSVHWQLAVLHPALGHGLGMLLKRRPPLCKPIHRRALQSGNGHWPRLFSCDLSYLNSMLAGRFRLHSFRTSTVPDLRSLSGCLRGQETFFAGLSRC